MARGNESKFIARLKHEAEIDGNVFSSFDARKVWANMTRRQRVAATKEKKHEADM